MGSTLRRSVLRPIRHALGHLRRLRPIVDYRPGPKNAVFLAGASRSGTTWVGELINYRGDYRYMFEPFARKNTRFSKIFDYALYLRPDGAHEEFYKCARGIISGRARDRHGRKYNRGILYGKRLIKEVRANLWLKWLRVQFPDLPIILLLRHPCAVTLSRMKRQLKNFFGDLFGQRELFDDHLEPFRRELEQARQADEWEQRLFYWCVEHYVPLRQFREGEIHLAFYEQFAENPKGELDRLFSYLGARYDSRIFGVFKRPSPVTKRWASIMTGESLIARWKDYVTASQLRRAVEILSLFGLDSIYSENAMPNTSNAFAMLSDGRSQGSAATRPREPF